MHSPAAQGTVPVPITGPGALALPGVTITVALASLVLVDGSGATNHVRVWDNPSAGTGNLLAAVTLAANGEATVPLSATARGSVYLTSTGAVSGTLWCA